MSIVITNNITVEASGHDKKLKKVKNNMILESLNEFINEAKSKPTLVKETGLINYFDIPFTQEDVEELVDASKKILNAKYTKNKQFEIQPMVFIKDKANGGEHTFSVAQIGILGSFYDKNKDKVASRDDF